MRQGIPDQFRSTIWQLQSGAHDSPLKQTYHKYLRDVSPFERAIRRDISRTYPKHDFFKEKVTSISLLKAIIQKDIGKRLSSIIDLSVGISRDFVYDLVVLIEARAPLVGVSYWLYY